MIPSNHYIPHRTTQRSSVAANPNGKKPYVMTRKSPGTSGSVSHHQPMLKARVSMADKEKKNYDDTHKQKSCGICFDFKPKCYMFQGGKCNHPFCTDCISKYVAAKILQNILKVNCPNPNCDVGLKPEYLKPILPKQVIDRWESAKYESSIALSQKFYCPFKNCSVLLVNDGHKGEVVTSSECPSCHRLFCAQCKVPWHTKMSCKEFQKLKRSKGEEDLDRKFLELAKSKMWQRCPQCSFAIERRSGCEHMTCRCGCNFCYQCGKTWRYGHLCNNHRST